MHDSSTTASQGRRTSAENPFGLDNAFLRPSSSELVKMEPREYPPPTTIGLGIVHGLPVSQSVSMHGWPNHSIIGTSACFESSVGAPDYGSLSYYQQQYSSGAVVNAPLMRYSGLNSRDQNTPVYYGIDPRTRDSNSPIYCETTTRWPITPQSQMGTPVQYSNQEGHPNSPAWKVSLSPAATNPPQSPIATGQRLADSKFSKVKLEYLKSSSSPHGTESDLEYDTYQQSSAERSVSPESCASDLPHCCEICGKRFTRRANCREHQKRHDPKQRPIFSCGDCGRTFSRKTDLKRHYSTKIHDGEKRYPCEKCGRAYNRLDTLHRHNKRGCPTRKSRASGMNHNPTSTSDHAQIRS